jgi:hypothetical protein
MERRKPCPAENLAQGKNNLLRESDEQDRQKLSAISGIQLGRKLIIAGFTISTAGIVTYCLFRLHVGQRSRHFYARTNRTGNNRSGNSLLVRRGIQILSQCCRG